MRVTLRSATRPRPLLLLPESEVVGVACTVATRGGKVRLRSPSSLPRDGRSPSPQHDLQGAEPVVWQQQQVGILHGKKGGCRAGEPFLPTESYSGLVVWGLDGWVLLGSVVEAGGRAVARPFQKVFTRDDENSREESIISFLYRAAS